MTTRMRMEGGAIQDSETFYAVEQVCSVRLVMAVEQVAGASKASRGSWRVI